MRAGAERGATSSSTVVQKAGGSTKRTERGGRRLSVASGFLRYLIRVYPAPGRRSSSQGVSEGRPKTASPPVGPDLALTAGEYDTGLLASPVAKLEEEGRKTTVFSIGGCR